MSSVRAVVLCVALAQALPVIAQTPPPADAPAGESAQGSSPGTPEAAATLPAPPAEPSAGVAAPAAAPRQPDLRPRPPVLGVADLRELSKADPIVRERYESLEGRRNAAALAAVGSVVGLTAAGVIAAAVGVADMNAQIDANICSGVSRGFGGGDCRKPESDYTAAYVALGVGVALGIVTFAVMPHRSDLDDAVALWNSRHPDDLVARTAPPRGTDVAAASANEAPLAEPATPDPPP